MDRYLAIWSALFRVRILASCSPPFTVVFADIGGNRELTHVVELLQLLSTTMHNLQYIAVKSDALALELGKAAPVNLQEQIEWWEDWSFGNVVGFHS